MKAIYSIVLLNCPPCPSFESTLRDQAVPKRVGFLIYPAMRALDLVGTMDAFSAVTLADSKARRRSGYELLTIEFDAKPVPAGSGLLRTPQPRVF